MPVIHKIHGMRSTDVDDYVAARSLTINARDVTVAEAIRLLRKYDVEAAEIQRVVKVDRFRVEVVLRTGEVVERFRASTDLPYQVRGKTYSVSYFGKQSVCLRVHWLPVIMNNDILHEVFGSFGKVMKVDFEKMGDYENGVRRVYMEVSVAERLELPHLLQFADGLKALVTMSGRAPLCLRCGEVGHVRQACPPLNSLPGAARATEVRAQRAADVPVAAPRRVEVAPVETAPVVAAPVAAATAAAAPAATAPTETAPAVTAPTTAAPAAVATAETAPTTAAPAETAPVETAPGTARPAAGREKADRDAESDSSESDMEWVEVRGRRRSRSRSSEGRGGCVKRTCGSGEDITPLPRNRYRSEGSSEAEPEITFSGLFTADSAMDDLLAAQSPHS